MNRPVLKIVQEDGTQIDARAGKPKSNVEFLSESSTPTTRLGTEDLYPDPATRSVPLHAALTLLYEAQVCLRSALDDRRAGDTLSADDQVCKFAAIMPELFCCREIGDGFALSVTSMFHAVQNRHGLPLEEKHILSLLFLLQFLRHNVFCTFESALDATEKLTTSGLHTDPPVLTPIGELVDF
jgi:hypothetical protein